MPVIRRDFVPNLPLARKVMAQVDAAVDRVYGPLTCRCGSHEPRSRSEHTPCPKCGELPFHDEEP